MQALQQASLACCLRNAGLRQCRAQACAHRARRRSASSATPSAISECGRQASARAAAGRGTWAHLGVPIRSPEQAACKPCRPLPALPHLAGVLPTTAWPNAASAGGRPAGSQPLPMPQLGHSRPCKAGAAGWLADWHLCAQGPTTAQPTCNSGSGDGNGGGCGCAPLLAALLPLRAAALDERHLRKPAPSSGGIAPAAGHEPRAPQAPS